MIKNVLEPNRGLDALRSTHVVPDARYLRDKIADRSASSGDEL